MRFDQLLDSGKPLKSRVIRKPKFLPIPPKKYILSDYVLSYFDGKKWKIVFLDDALQYPVIHDQYFDELLKRDDENIISDISFTFCPFSFSGVVYFGKFVPSGEIYNNNMILNDEENIKLLHQLSGKTYIRKSTEELKDYLRKGEVKIMSFRSALSLYPDCLFFHNKKPQSELVDKSYINNKFIVYGILYNSSNVRKNAKSSVVVVSKQESFDYLKSGYHKYFEEQMEKIKEKGGLIIPCFWSAWKLNFPDSKIVEI